MSDHRKRELARFLSQRRELGQDPLIMGGLSRTEALDLATNPAGAPAAHVDRTQAPPPSSAAPASRAPVTDPLTTPPPAATERRPGPEQEAPSSPGGSPDAMLDYETLRATALSCTRCGLSGTRTQVVFSDGNPNARLVVVGEAPGANEDRTGVPFVGQAGKMLDLLLAAVGLSRQDSVYICNVLKCRPPGNRNPAPEEIQLCAPFLKRQIGLVSPQAILAVGTFSAQLLTGLKQPLGKLRGSLYSYEGVPLVVSYHPAALLRNSGWTRATWDDFQLLRQVLDGT